MVFTYLCRMAKKLTHCRNLRIHTHKTFMRVKVTWFLDILTIRFSYFIVLPRLFLMHITSNHFMTMTECGTTTSNRKTSLKRCDTNNTNKFSFELQCSKGCKGFYHGILSESFNSTWLQWCSFQKEPLVWTWNLCSDVCRDSVNYFRSAS